MAEQTKEGFCEDIHSIRKEISRIEQKVRFYAEQRMPAGGAELTLSWRSLQLAKMWLGKVLEENDNPLPPEFADNAEDPKGGELHD